MTAKNEQGWKGKEVVATFLLLCISENKKNEKINLFNEIFEFISSPANEIFVNVSLALWLLLHCHSSLIPLLIQISALHYRPEVYKLFQRISFLLKHLRK
jgi:CRISPR/Cas system endoribonuclease Cas6 (RAMP superfamily)